MLKNLLPRDLLVIFEKCSFYVYPAAENLHIITANHAFIISMSDYGTKIFFPIPCDKLLKVFCHFLLRQIFKIFKGLEKLYFFLYELIFI